MAVIQRSTDFRSVVAPILNQVADGVYKQRKDEYKELFAQEDGIARSYHEEPMLYGMGNAPIMPDGTKVPYDAGGQLFTKRYAYDIYGIGFAITKVLEEDGDHIRIGSILSKHAMQSVVETVETVHANIMNRAFNSTYKGGDGVELCSNAHIGAVSFTAGAAAVSNVLATSAALSQTSFEQMLIQIRSAEDPRGKKIRLAPKKLVVHPANMLQAAVILESIQRSGTANNDVNPVKGDADVYVMSRLTSGTAWWVTTDAQNGLKTLWRRKPETSSEGDFDTDSARFKITTRFGAGWTDWRAAYGTPGT